MTEKEIENGHWLVKHDGTLEVYEVKDGSVFGPDRWFVIKDLNPGGSYTIVFIRKLDLEALVEDPLHKQLKDAHKAMKDVIECDYSGPTSYIVDYLKKWEVDVWEEEDD